MLLLKTFTSSPVVHNPDTVTGISVKDLPETGELMVAAVVGGGLGIVPCKPVFPDCSGSGLPMVDWAKPVPTTPNTSRTLSEKIAMMCDK